MRAGRRTTGRAGGEEDKMENRMSGKECGTKHTGVKQIEGHLGVKGKQRRKNSETGRQREGIVRGGKRKEGKKKKRGKTEEGMNNKTLQQQRI